MFGFLNHNTDNNEKSNMVMLTEADVKRLKHAHGVILFFMNGCGHCVDMKGDWNAAVDECRNSGIGHDKDDFVLGAIESGNMNMFKQNGITTNVNGYPTILYITSEGIRRGDMNHEKYEKPRTKVEFINWIKEKKNKKKGKTEAEVNKLVINNNNNNNKNKGKQSGGGGGRRRTHRRNYANVHKSKSKSKSKRHMKRHTRRHTRTRRSHRHHRHHRFQMKGGECDCGAGGIGALLSKDS